MKRDKQLILAVLCVFIASCYGLQFYVSTTGSDSNPGTMSKPFATVVRARDAIRQISRPLPKGGVTVYIETGSYPPNSSVVQFTNADSGDSNVALITYTSVTPSKPARLLGGLNIPPNSWNRYTNEIYHVNLKQVLGITDFGKITPRSADRTELFFNGKPMTLARYPNNPDDWLYSAGTSASDSKHHKSTHYKNALFSPSAHLERRMQQLQTNKPLPSFADAGNLAFQYNTSQVNPAKWVSAPDLWLHGYWAVTWFDSNVHVTSIDLSTHTFNIDPATPPHYGFSKYDRYYAFNLLQELDAPGEYYIDRQTGDCYFYPPSSLQASEATVSTYSGAILQFNDVSYVHVTNLEVSVARTNAIVVQGNSHSLVFKNNIITNCGQVGLLSQGAMYSTIESNTLFGQGSTAIIISAGDVKSLTPGNVVVTLNTIHSFSRLDRCYEPGVLWDGVGNNVTSNTIYNAPHNAILGNGNNHLFFNNTVHDVCYEVSDAGAWYSGRSWSDRGNKIYNNTFFNVVNNRCCGPFFHDGTNVQAVYLDDQLSGYDIRYNRFYNNSVGMLVGGGRRNYVESNLFENNMISINFDNRGMNWQSAICQPGGALEQGLEAVGYQSEIWRKAYPELANIMSDYPCVPVFNVFANNRWCPAKNGWNNGQFMNVDQATVQSWKSTVANNTKIC